MGIGAFARAVCATFDPNTVVELDLGLSPESIEALELEPDEYVCGTFEMKVGGAAFEVDEGKGSKREDLEALIVAANDEAGDWSDGMGAVADLDEMTRMWAVERYIGHSLDIAPSGTKQTLRSRCGGEPVRGEPNIYRGAFEFHGEEGYTEASATTLHEYPRFFLDIVCGGGVGGEAGGEGLLGAKLRLLSRGGPVRLDLQANKNRPGARSRFEVEVDEKRGRIGISRSTTVWAGADAFDYDPLLRTATLEPPSPFSGRATYRRGAAAVNRWTGNLTVDLPGRSAIPLTGSRVRARLVPACRREDSSLIRC